MHSSNLCSSPVSGVFRATVSLISFVSGELCVWCDFIQYILYEANFVCGEICALCDFIWYTLCLVWLHVIHSVLGVISCDTLCVWCNSHLFVLSHTVYLNYLPKHSPFCLIWHSVSKLSSKALSPFCSLVTQWPASPSDFWEESESAQQRKGNHQTG